MARVGQAALCAPQACAEIMVAAGTVATPGMGGQWCIPERTLLGKFDGDGVIKEVAAGLTLVALTDRITCCPLGLHGRCSVSALRRASCISQHSALHDLLWVGDMLPCATSKEPGGGSSSDTSPFASCAEPAPSILFEVRLAACKLREFPLVLRPAVRSGEFRLLRLPVDVDSESSTCSFSSRAFLSFTILAITCEWRSAAYCCSSYSACTRSRSSSFSRRSSSTPLSSFRALDADASKRSATGAPLGSSWSARSRPRAERPSVRTSRMFGLPRGCFSIAFRGSTYLCTSSWMKDGSNPPTVLWLFPSIKEPLNVAACNSGHIRVWSRAIASTVPSAVVIQTPVAGSALAAMVVWLPPVLAPVAVLPEMDPIVVGGGAPQPLESKAVPPLLLTALPATAPGVVEAVVLGEEAIPVRGAARSFGLGLEEGDRLAPLRPLRLAGLPMVLVRRLLVLARFPAFAPPLAPADPAVR